MTPDVQDCEWCPIVTEIWQRNESEWRGLHTIATWQRGFIATIRLSWADWLRHHEALYWHPKQTVECPKCVHGMCNDMDIGDIMFIEWPCENCGGFAKDEHGLPANVPGSGRIARPFVATAQPITRVELTTWPCEPMTGINASAIGVREHTFNRVKCPECDGRGLVNAANGPIVEGDPIYQCPACRGNHLNEWHCDQWPTITFVMP